MLCSRNIIKCAGSKSLLRKKNIDKPINTIFGKMEKAFHVIKIVHGRCSQLSSSICKTLHLKSMKPVEGKGFSHERIEKLNNCVLNIYK